MAAIRRDGRVDAPATSSHPIDPKAWRSLAVVLVGSFMALLDTTIVNVALPSIRNGLNASSATLVWVISGYILAFGLALIPSGRLGDRIGHKPLFVFGIALFTLASVGCGLARSPAELLISRVVQGIGAGVYYPGISATIQLGFSGASRSKAFGIVGATIGVSTAIGPILGGLIIGAAGPHEGWRWVFLVNLFIGAVEVPTALRLIPQRRADIRRGLDPVGLVLLTSVLLLLLLPLVDGEEQGWPPWCFGCFAATLPAAMLLRAWERRVARRGGEPLLSPSLLRRLSFTAGAALAVCFFAGWSSLFFMLTILWQTGLHHSALSAGVLVLPTAIGSIISGPSSARLSRRFGRGVMVLGVSLILVGTGLLLLVLIVASPSPNDLELVGPLFLSGLGANLVIPPNQDFVLESVPHPEAGTAGATLYTMQRIGTSLGTAVVGTVFFGTLGRASSPIGIAHAYVHSTTLGAFANLGFVLASLALIAALPTRRKVTNVPDPVAPVARTT